MPALKPISPVILKRIVELAGYKVIQEDDYNWHLAKTKHDRPIILPKKGGLVAVEIMMNILNKLKMNNATYFEYLDKAQNENPGQVIKDDSIYPRT